MARARRAPGSSSVVVHQQSDDLEVVAANEERKRYPLGRKPLLEDKEVVGKILAAVAAGASFNDACIAADVDHSTFYKWRQRFEQMPPEKRRPGNPYFDFFEALKRARVRGKVNNIVAIKLAGKKDWRSLAWLLERQYPDEWGKQSRLEVSGPQGRAVPVRIEIPPRDEAIELWDGEALELPGAKSNGK